MLVDTGSSTSLVSPWDVENLNLLGCLSELELSPIRKLGIGGTVRSNSYLLPAVIALQGTTASMQFLFGEGKRGLLEVKPPQGAPGEYRVPSILGWDVLGDLVCLFDRQKGTVRLYAPGEYEAL